jgi:hypothetical protein
LRPAVVLAAVSLAAVSLAAASPARASGWWRPGPVQSWHWQISDWPVDMTRNVQVYDIDYDASENGTQAQVTSAVAQLHARGVKVICYLVTGGYESYRPDAGAYSPAWIGNSDGWPGENWINMNALFDGSTGPSGKTLRQILDARFAQCKAEGFDGVETDLDETYKESSGFASNTMAVNERFNETLAADIHADGLAWFLKNGVEEDSFITDQLTSADPPDGTVNEQCHQYSECGELKPFVTAGKPILNAEYQGTQSAICPKALSFPMATARFPLNLNGDPRWVCWQ